LETKRFLANTTLWVTIWGVTALAALAIGLLVPGLPVLRGGITPAQLLAILAGILAATEIVALLTQLVWARQGKPAAEGLMIRRLYRLVAVLVLALVLAQGFGALAAFGSLFAMFGGMLLGWSLQAPVSGLAAWALVSLKRPFRPGDRVQFPSLNLVGDVKDIGFMYTMLDQVGGSISSEEAVGRYILVPNAMLFSQVVINYTVKQEAAYMLDEVVIRITYDSDWETAERILIDAATEATAPIIQATGVQPYIRSDWYDYGVYLRLRYLTQVKERVEIAYNIQKLIFERIQHTPSVDMAIPYVYSYRASMDRKEEEGPRQTAKVRELDITSIQPSDFPADADDVELLAKSIASQGLLQPIMVARNAVTGKYDIIAGHLRYEACKRLGWKIVPATVKSE
jgi:small-conductance mechanosensitive channel